MTIYATTIDGIHSDIIFASRDETAITYQKFLRIYVYNFHTIIPRFTSGILSLCRSQSIAMLVP